MRAAPVTAPLRIGLVSPVVTAPPGGHSDWERDAGPEQLSAVAELADRLGVDHLTCSEHVAVPRHIAEQRGGTYWDPLATLSFLAARTTRIRLVTHVLVLGYHHPLEIAKRYGTLDRLSGGRVVLGVGVGTLQEEFELLGASFNGRGARADEALRALRATLGQREPQFHGQHFDFADVVVEPHAVQARLPLWIGGRSLRSLRRARALGDGWVPFGVRPEEARAWLQETADEAGGRPLEVVLPAGPPLDPAGRPDHCRERLRRAAAAGATIVSVALTSRCHRHYLEQLHAVTELAARPGS